MPERIKHNSCASPLLKFSTGFTYPPFPPHRLHTHEICELYHVVRGSGHYITEGSRHELKAGRIILMRPGEMHKAELSDEEVYETAIFHFSPAIVDGFDPNRRLLAPFFDRPLGQHNVYDRAALATTDIYSLFQKSRERHENDYDNQIHATSILIGILEQLKTLFDSEQYTVSSKSSDVMHNVVAYVNQNLTQNLTSEQICEEFNFSRAQMDRNFKSTTGSTIRAYITTKRLLMAKAYLREGMCATEAAAACGFQNYSTFYRAYAKHFGTTPSGIPTVQDSDAAILYRN